MSNFLSDQYTVGTLLREEREKQGKTIQEVSHATHIRSMFLEFLEEDRFDKLPSKLHITGFIQVYSKFLGIDEQFILNAYKKQEYLNQEIPAEEIFSISRDFSYGISKHHNKFKMLFWILTLLCIILVGYYGFKVFSTKYSTHNSISKDNHIVFINDITPSHIFHVKPGENFSFSIKGELESFQVLEITDSSITIKHIKDQIVLPPFSFSEALEYDLDEDLEFDYTLFVKQKTTEDTIIQVQQIHVLKNENQQNYIIVKNNINDFDDTSITDTQGVLSLQNTSSNKTMVIAIDNKKNSNLIELNPMEKKYIKLLDDNKQFLYSSIYIQNISAINLSLEGNIISRQQFLPGSVAVLSCRFKTALDKQIVCPINVGKY